jgi:CBS domain-containing protein
MTNRPIDPQHPYRDPGVDRGEGDDRRAGQAAAGDRPGGRLVGIVSRHDILRLFARPDDEVRESVVHALAALGADLERLRVEVNGGLVLLDGPVDDGDTARTVVAVVAAIPGVVDVLDQLRVPAS